MGFFMDRKEKIVAAISAAIYMYLEEEALSLQAMAAYAPVYREERPSLPITSAWSFAGRCAAMERRFNWQMRMCKF